MDPVDFIELLRPPERVLLDVPLPTPQPRRALGLAEPLLALLELPARPRALLDLLAQLLVRAPELLGALGDAALQILVHLPHRLLHALPAHDRGRGREHGHRDNGHEPLEQEKRDVHRMPRERSVPAQGAVDRDRGEKRQGGGAFPLLEAERAPEDRRQAEVLDRIAALVEGRERGEDEGAGRDDREDEEEELHAPARSDRAPIPAPTVAAAGARPVKAKMVLGRSRTWTPPAKRRTR